MNAELTPREFAAELRRRTFVEGAAARIFSMSSGEPLTALLADDSVERAETLAFALEKTGRVSWRMGEVKGGSK